MDPTPAKRRAMGSLLILAAGIVILGAGSSMLALYPAAPCPDCVFRSKFRSLPEPGMKTADAPAPEPVGCEACSFKGKVSLLKKWAWKPPGSR